MNNDNDDNVTNNHFDLSKPRVTLGKSNESQLKREAREWVAEAKKEVRTWDKYISSSK